MATEKRLIDAIALKETVTTDYYEHFTRYHDTDQIALIDMVCDDIEEAPTVDAVEVVYAHWIHDDEYDICSHCRNPVVLNRMTPDKFCKNCGANMRGRKDND